jgi:pantetheine-phosphate adenylyltransferase
MKKAIYALSADPPTWGHLNIVSRALSVFDNVIFGIGINPEKKYTFTLEERETLAKRVLQKFGDRVLVKSFPGLLSDFAYENGIQTVIRGARNSSDFDFERLLNDINQSFRQGLDTIIYVAETGLSHVSSSAAKELVKNQAKNLLEYVPLPVKSALERKINGQVLIGITGEIACGKSYTGEALCKLNNEEALKTGGRRAYNIDLDAIGREILQKAESDIYRTARETLAEYFGADLLTPDGKVDLTKLKQKIFSDAANKSLFDDVMREPMLLLLRRTLMGKKGIFFINSALIADENICSFVNNNIVHVRCPENEQTSNMQERGYDSDEIKRRLSSQLSAERKDAWIKGQIRKDSFGNLIDFSNSRGNPHGISELYEELKTKVLDSWF